MALEKMIIKNLDSRDDIEVLFNPTELTISDSCTWQEQKRHNRRPELQFTGGAQKTLSMQLFFDTYELDQDVRVYTNKIAELLEPTDDKRKGQKKNQGKRPPKVSISWGNADNNTSVRIFPSTWVLEKLTQKFTLFRDNGTPVRALLDVTFKEYLLPVEQEKRNPRRHSFPYQTYTIKAGDTINNIAALLWNDPNKWRIIAEKNQIDNPRLLKTGQTLLIPEIK